MYNDRTSDEINIACVGTAQTTDFSPSKCTWLAETIFGLISANADFVYLCTAWRQIIAGGFRRVDTDNSPECEPCHDYVRVVRNIDGILGKYILHVFMVLTSKRLSFH